MRQNQSVADPQKRQRKMDYGEESLWPVLPESCRLECQRLITQLLVEVIHERKQEGGSDERED